MPPEWFYKGPGTILRAHGDPLSIPPYGEDGGEEPELAGAYIIDETGSPRRVGIMMGNEFSDHKIEKKNYLYLAVSEAPLLLRRTGNRSRSRLLSRS